MPDSPKFNDALLGYRHTPRHAMTTIINSSPPLDLRTHWQSQASWGGGGGGYVMQPACGSRDAAGN